VRRQHLLEDSYAQVRRATAEPHLLDAGRACTRMPMHSPAQGALCDPCSATSVSAGDAPSCGHKGQHAWYLDSTCRDCCTHHSQCAHWQQLMRLKLSMCCCCCCYMLLSFAIALPAAAVAGAAPAAQEAGRVIHWRGCIRQRRAQGGAGKPARRQKYDTGRALPAPLPGIFGSHQLQQRCRPNSEDACASLAHTYPLAP
jgi:hypothetical protein